MLSTDNLKVKKLDRPTRVAFIGLGKNGLAHFRAFEELGISEVEIVGFLIRDIQKAMKATKIQDEKKYFSDIETLNRIARPDLVVISVPIQLTAKIMENASQYDWDILVEKPLGVNLNECNKLLEIFATKRDSSCFVGLNRRFLPTSLAISELIQDYRRKSNSKIIVSVKDRQSRTEAREMGYEESVINNWHFANSIHTIDLGISYLGLYRESDFNIQTRSHDPNFLVNATIESSNLGILNYEGIWSNQGFWGVAIYTDSWWINQTPLETINASNQIKTKVDELLEIYSEKNHIKPGYLNQAKAVLGINSSLSKFLVDLKESQYTMQIIERVFN